jgi:hypothetical protein
MPTLGVNAEMAITLEPEEFAAKLLLLIRQLTEETPSYRPRHDELQATSWNYLTSTSLDLPSYVRQQYFKAFSEAWAWLEVQRLLVPDRDVRHGSGHVETGRRQLSRRAVCLQDEVAIGHYAVACRLPREGLHSAIATTVWSAFVRGEYDVAVFQAMKAVEVAVREAAGLSAKDLGTSLMRAAFHLETGPLTDMDAEKAEREARSNRSCPMSWCRSCGEPARPGTVRNSVYGLVPHNSYTTLNDMTDPLRNRRRHFCTATIQPPRQVQRSCANFAN